MLDLRHHLVLGDLKHSHFSFTSNTWHQTLTLLVKITTKLQKYQSMKITNAINSSVNVNPLIEPPSLTIMVSISSLKDFYCYFFINARFYVLKTWSANKIYMHTENHQTKKMIYSGNIIITNVEMRIAMQF